MKGLIEGLLFVCGEDGLTLEELTNITGKQKEDIKNIIQELYKDYDNSDRGIQLEYLGNHFKLTTKKEHKEYYKKLFEEEENSNLSESCIEVLAIIAYNAPITRTDIDEIRGVNSSYAVRKLLIKNLIEEVGRSELPGRPKLYNVTSNFLDYFGLGTIDDLPKLEIKKEENIDLNNDLFKSKYVEEEKGDILDEKN